MAAFDAPPQRKLVGVSVVARHGARYPNPAELAAFSLDSAVRTQWHEKDGTVLYGSDNNLREAGRRQMRALGKFLGKKYGAVVAAGPLEWESSPADRCVESGRHALAGLRDAAPSLHVPDAPLDDGSRAATFKAWDAKGTAYKAFVDGLKAGDDGAFNERAEARRAALDATYAACGEDHACGVRDAQLYYWSCYAHCLAEAELYDDAGRCAFRGAAGADALEALEGDARWIWERRFLRSGFGEFIGGALRDKAVAPRAGLKFFSGHDYSILSMLAALGVRDYDAVLGFGAYVAVEHYDDGTTAILLHAAPFRAAGGGVAADVDVSSLAAVEPATRSFWESSSATIAAAASHPFLVAMVDGNLPMAKFRYYVEQDSLYLKDFGDALRLLATKAPTRDAAARLDGFAAGADGAERALHASLFAGWGIKDGALPRQAPHTLLYTSYLLRVCATRPYAEGVAALLPCFWVYAHVGDAMLARRTRESTERPPQFDAWIDMYGGDAFHAAVRDYRALVEDAARADPAATPRMAEHFATACDLENMFWTQALDGLAWP